MASITVASATANDRHLNCASTTSSIITSSPPTSGSSSPTTYLLLTTTHSDVKPVGKSSIAPKRSNHHHNHHLTDSSGSQTSVLRAKRKIQFATSGESQQAPPAVARRNERERNRVRQVNMGFATLRQHVPNGAKSKKMSKVETLRSAVDYIKQLQELLDETGHSDNGDENSLPSFEDVAQVSSGHHFRSHQHPVYHHHQNGQISEKLSLVGVTSPQYSAASSPTPSLGSEASSPYESLSPEDEDLLDFTTWLS